MCIRLPCSTSPKLKTKSGLLLKRWRCNVVFFTRMNFTYVHGKATFRFVHLVAGRFIYSWKTRTWRVKMSRPTIVHFAQFRKLRSCEDSIFRIIQTTQAAKPKRSLMASLTFRKLSLVFREKSFCLQRHLRAFRPPSPADCATFYQTTWPGRKGWLGTTKTGASTRCYSSHTSTACAALYWRRWR